MIVWCVTDDKPGHKNQLFGLVNALAEQATVRCQWFSINNKASWDTSQRPDIILTAGSSTHWSALKLRWQYGGKLVVLMRPLFPFWLFDLCFIPEHDGVRDSRRVVTTKGAITPVRFSEQSDSKKGLILIGGPSKHYGWSDESIVEQLFSLRENYPDINWMLTTSRRTPQSFLPALTTVIEEQQVTCLDIVPFEETGSAWLLARYKECGVIWASEDSVSMVYESLSSGAVTGILDVPRLSDNRVSRGLDQLYQEHRVVRLGDENESLLQNEPLREADRAAGIIIDRLLPITS